ncbi:hypothetical protein [Nitrosomonas sp. Nm34]|uniref:hypothetical protein n=1 Tax=Nitrosomonas sp. Nm34 TaxID=1881055 RepID=UPI0008EB9A94|nr:hypothetical protein [Nitrosomonas sp. Nm34]SFI36142.1 hypothetical protein SAMN05428978_10079 [Nitrosomonas sp. Nm34]
MNITLKIFGLSLWLIFNAVNAENIRIPIKSGPNGAVTFDSNIANDGMQDRMNSVGGGFSSISGHRANATVNIERGEGTINYARKNSNGAVTFNSNFSNDEAAPLMSSAGGSFSSTNGHGANATVNMERRDGTINYSHNNFKRTITFDTNLSNDGTGLQMNSVGGNFSGKSGHGVSATVNATGSVGAINYIHTNHKTKIKFNSGVNINNGNHAANIGVQIPFGAK